MSFSPPKLDQMLHQQSQLQQSQGTYSEANSQESNSVFGQPNSLRHSFN